MFSEKLKYNRIKLGLSLEDLAYNLNVSVEVISNWESGLSLPDLDTVVKISEFFNLSIDYLLTDRKSNSNFNYYTVEKEEKKSATRHRIISLGIFTISIISFLTLLAISMVEPITYFNSSNGITYKGLMAYYYTFSEFKTVAIFTFLVMIFSSISLFVPEEKLKNLFQKKIK